MPRQIKIIHEEGAWKGTVETFDGENATLLAGRGESANIRFEEQVVGHRHLELVAQAGAVQIRLLPQTTGKPYSVWVNGSPARAGDFIASGSSIRLGKENGPGFRVEYCNDGKNHGKISASKTITQQVMETTRELLRKSTARTSAMAGVAIVGVAVLGVMFILQRSELERMADELRELARNEIKEDYVTILAESSYAVWQDGEVVATAWPVAPGLLATSAHVALAHDKAELLVRKPVPGGGESKPPYVVTGYKLHPAYQEFSAFMTQEDLGSYTGKRFAGIDRIGSYDVALLMVEPKDDFGGVKFLDMARPAELDALEPGDPLAFAGYPAEVKGGATARAPQVQFGWVTSLSDFFLLPAENAHEQLVQHSMPAGGGTSGSPVISRSGHVVAILSGGNQEFISGPGGDTDGLPSAVQINFAQRVDLLDGLMKEDEETLLGLARPYWNGKAQELTSWEQHSSAIVKGFASQFARLQCDVDAGASEDHQLFGNGVVIDGDMAFREHRFRTQAGLSYGFVAQPASSADASAGKLHLITLQADNAATKLLHSWDGFPRLRYNAQTSGSIVLRVGGSKSVHLRYRLHTICNRPMADRSPEEEAE
jgi:hypothetical protein